MNGSFAFVGDERVGSYATRRLSSLGWTRARSIADAPVIVTYGARLADVEDIYFDDDGLVKSAVAGSLLVDLSACTPSLAREVAAVAMVNDLRPVEAPLALRGLPAPGAAVSPDDTVCYVAGGKPDVDEVRPLLETLAGSVIDVGASGAAQIAKAEHTVQFCAQVVGAVESGALRRSSGSPVRAAGHAGAGKDLFPGLSGQLRAAAEREDFKGGFTIDLLLGDVIAAMTAADDVDLILPQLEAAMHLLELIAVIGGADLSLAALSLLYREEAAGTAHGLDWTRAEGMYADQAVDTWHTDDYGFPGGFDGYSAN